MSYPLSATLAPYPSHLSERLPLADGASRVGHFAVCGKVSSSTTNVALVPTAAPSSAGVS